MDFSFSEEQTLLRNSVDNFLRDNYDFDARRKILTGEEGYSRKIWEQMAALGLLALPFGEAAGGLDDASVETMILMESFGGALLLEPYFPAIICAGGVLRRASKEQQQAWIPELAEGKTIWALAHAEPSGRYDLFDVSTSAKKDGGGYVVSGHKMAVSGGGAADKFIISARTGGSQRDKEGVSLFVVDAKQAGVSRRDYRAVDGNRVAELMLEDVKLDGAALIGEEGQGVPVLERVAEEAIAALAAEASGAMRALHRATLDYCRQRKQFGQPIASFQVIQHRLVDMFVACEQATSMAYMMALNLDAPPEQRAKAASAAKVRIGQDGRYVGQQAVQLHGGMGMTDELNVSHYFKRLTVIDALFGNVDYHLARYGEFAPQS